MFSFLSCRPQLGKQPKEQKKRTVNRPASGPQVENSNFSQFHAKVKEAVPNCGFAKYGMITTTVRCKETESATSTESTETYITTNPPSLPEIKLASEILIETLSLTDEAIEELENETLDQSKSTRWFEERQKRLTASNFHSVLVRRTKTEPDSLIRRTLGYVKQAQKP